MDLPPDFRDLLEAFARESVEFVVVGGYAVAFHARPRATKDIDILLAGDPENLDRASRALAAFGAPPAVVTATRTLGEAEGQPPLRIDLLRAIDGVDAPGLFERAVKATFDGVPVRVLDQQPGFPPVDVHCVSWEEGAEDVRVHVHSPAFGPLVLECLHDFAPWVGQDVTTFAHLAFRVSNRALVTIWYSTQTLDCLHLNE